MRNISPHISLVDHVRNEALCLVRGNIVFRNTQRGVEHRHGDPCTFVTRHPPAHAALSIKSMEGKNEGTYTRLNNPLMQSSRAFSIVIHRFSSTRRRSQ